MSSPKRSSKRKKPTTNVPPYPPETPVSIQPLPPVEDSPLLKWFQVLNSDKEIRRRLQICMVDCEKAEQELSALLRFLNNQESQP